MPAAAFDRSRTRASCASTPSKARAGRRRPPGADRRGLSDSLRHSAGQPRRARAVPRQGPLRRRSRRRRHRARRSHGRSRRQPDRRRATSRCARSRRPPTASPTPSRASTTTATTATCTRPWRCSSATSMQAIDGADHVFDDVFFFEGNTHLPIEQHATVALKDPDGKLVVYSSTQTPHYLHRALAKALAMPAAHIRVIATPNGGGFGGKSDPFNHEIVVAKAALLLDRPVKICLNREEVFYCHRGRHPVLMRFRTGVTNDGKITGLDLQTLLDGGAYGSYGVASTFYTGALQTVTYDIPRYRFRGCRVFTNKPPCGPKRGHGTPQSRFGQEVQLDKIAEHLKRRSRRVAAWHRRAARLADRQLHARRHHRPRRMHPARRRAIAAGARSSASCRSAAASGWRARRICPAPACRSTGTICRTPACSSSSIAAAASPCSAAPPRSARDRTMCWWRWWRKCSASIRSTCARSPATPTSRRSISVRTRAASR